VIGLPARTLTQENIVMSSRRKLMIILVGTLALLVPANASAGQPDSVDPAIMQPSLNASFGPWDCWRTGTGIVCDGARTLAWEGAETGFICEGRPVYSTGTDERTQRRFGDEAGLALRTIQRVSIRETLSLSADGSGPSLQGVGQFTERFEYLIAGDLSSRTDTFTGIDVRVTGAGVGLVIHEVGIKSFDIDDNVLLVHGPHPVLDDFEGSFAKLCDAFEAMGA
jgi:hypothetical protein